LIFRIFSRNKKDKQAQGAGDEYSLGNSEHFAWQADSGAESISGVDWVRKNGIPYLEKAYVAYKNEILQLGDANRLPIPVVVRASSSCQGGIGGATGNGELSYCAGHWASNQFCYGIIAHELCNLFTGERVSGGWPTEWWANHRSPFPTMITNQAIRRIVPEYYKGWGDYNDPLLIMYDRLYSEYSGMFPRMFQKMRELNVRLSEYEEPYLSHVVYYFMFYGAGKQLGNYFVVPPMPPINPGWIQEIEKRFKLGVI
jgi:hypothetical protein